MTSPPVSQSPRICAVLAADAGFFYQTRLAIESIRRADGGSIDIRLIAIGPYERGQREWLEAAGVTFFDRIDDIPRFNGAPLHAAALTCRPYLPQIFPDVDGIIWVDSDIRFVRPAGLMPWTSQAGDPACPVAAVQETEPQYAFNFNPFIARNYHRGNLERLRTVYGDDVAESLEYYKMFNAGLFAMPAASAVWNRYRTNLEKSLQFPYDKMREQDALNVAIIEEGNVRAMPATLNWLCSCAMPVRSEDGNWLTPNAPQRGISVAHLTNSGDLVPGTNFTYYDLYRDRGLTA